MSYGLEVYDDIGNESVVEFTPRNILKIIPMSYTYVYGSTKVYINTPLPPNGGGVIKYMISGTGFTSDYDLFYLPLDDGDVVIGIDSISYALVGSSTQPQYGVGQQSGANLVVINDRS